MFGKPFYNVAPAYFVIQTLFYSCEQPSNNNVKPTIITAYNFIDLITLQDLCNHYNNFLCAITTFLKPGYY